jgi:hypothetical protein
MIPNSYDAIRPKKVGRAEQDYQYAATEARNRIPLQQALQTEVVVPKKEDFTGTMVSIPPLKSIPQICVVTSV